MMLWKDEWHAISKRIDGLLTVAKLLVAGNALEESWRMLSPQVHAVFPLIKEFHGNHGANLPVAANRALSSFVRENENAFRGAHIDNMHAIHLLGILGSFRASLDYHLSDTEAMVRKAVERAFAHLQRSIVADQDISRKWQAAFQNREEACEMLGGAHLILHGLWAFKAHASGGRTDLVLGEHLKLEQAQQAADALILTEWKLVRDGDSAVMKAEEAKQQSERYAGETLAGFELTSCRYIVLVSRDLLSPIPTVAQLSGRNYEVRNIAVNPSSPSQAAANSARSGRPS